MKKPEWFELVDALEKAPEPVAPMRASRRARLAKGLTGVGAAVLIAGGGLAFAQSNVLGAINFGSTAASSGGTSLSASAPATPAAPAASAPSASTPAAVPSAASPTTVGSASAAGSAKPSLLTGGKPSISGAGAAGDDGEVNDD
ncbi:MAG TPA: hypothetical protein VMV52_06085 [Candidatus Nanopelagicaceae bacterium]|nr:hypothetical protein [Candidatus Nanopelagicaceae bacterium]